jgi:2-amino-4-hydroxy-6-hydroxymethyldihydropteridine diphosphokinase
MMMISANVAIALGSNLGDSAAILAAAIEQLDQIPGIKLERYSHWYQTVAVGPPQPDYLNGCAVLQVVMKPHLLLETLLSIEATFGRIRKNRWGPRTLDLDLLLYDQLVLATPMLQIPHPYMIKRAFVLVPLSEIAPDWIEPVTGKTIAELVQMVDTSGVKRVNSE